MLSRPYRQTHLWPLLQCSTAIVRGRRAGDDFRLWQNGAAVVADQKSALEVPAALGANTRAVGGRLDATVF